MEHLNEDEIVGYRFQLDGATAHTARVSMMLLRGVFGDRIILKQIWPSLSLQDSDQCKTVVNVEYGVLTAVVTKSTIFSDITLCRPLKIKDLALCSALQLLSRCFLTQLILQP
jgi:hypothetical protein